MLTRSRPNSYVTVQNMYWENWKCCISNFDRSLGRANGPQSEKMTYLDFVVKKEHSFIRIISERKDLSACPEICTLESYFENFKKFIQVPFLLKNNYSPQSDVEFIPDECIEEILRDNEIEDFQNLYIEISNVRIKM